MHQYWNNTGTNGKRPQIAVALRSYGLSSPTWTSRRGRGSVLRSSGCITGSIRVILVALSRFLFAEPNARLLPCDAFVTDFGILAVQVTRLAFSILRVAIKRLCVVACLLSDPFLSVRWRTMAQVIVAIGWRVRA
jgi:hypothetical protein